MTSFLGNRLTYFGLLDDVVARYPFSDTQGWDAIERSLVVHAIYGKPVLINDGYLIANEQLVPQLADLDVSLLGNMLMFGFARLFARGGVDLAAGIEERAASINTHRRILERTDWPEIRDNLEFLSKLARPTTVPWPRTKNTGEILFRLLDESLGTEARRRLLEDPEDWPLFERVVREAVADSGATYSGLRSRV